jgi:hypothetical protein
MGWYHAEQMLRGDVPSAKLCYVVEPWFLGAGKYLTALCCAALIYHHRYQTLALVRFEEGTAHIRSVLDKKRIGSSAGSQLEATVEAHRSHLQCLSDSFSHIILFRSLSI